MLRVNGKSLWHLGGSPLAADNFLIADLAYGLDSGSSCPVLAAVSGTLRFNTLEQWAFG